MKAVELELGNKSIRSDHYSRKIYANGVLVGHYVNKSGRIHIEAIHDDPEIQSLLNTWWERHRGATSAGMKAYLARRDAQDEARKTEELTAARTALGLKGNSS